MQFVHLDH